jgi:hypothetical protein
MTIETMSDEREDRLIDLRAALRALAESADPESSHGEADGLLLEFINDREVTEAYNALTRWYA